MLDVGHSVATTHDVCKICLSEYAGTSASAVSLPEHSKYIICANAYEQQAYTFEPAVLLCV